VSIRRLEVKGFRSLRHVVWEPGPLNVLIGPNAGGKSNLLRLVELLSVAATGGLGEHVRRMGGMVPLVWDGTAEAVEVILDCDPCETQDDPKQRSLTYELELRRLGGSSMYRLENELLANYYRVRTGEHESPLKFVERYPGHAVVFDPEQKGLVAHEGALPDEETLLAAAGGPFAVNRIVHDFAQRLSAWAVHRDIRTDRDAPLRQSAVTRREPALAADGGNLVQCLHTLCTTDRSFRSNLGDAMHAAFGAQFEDLLFPPEADQRVQMRMQWRPLSTAQSAADLSDGTLRFMLLIAVLARSVLPPLIAIDEPELGLHPSMLPIIAEFAAEASRRTQVVLATHSPEFLDAFTELEDKLTVTVVEAPEGATVLRNVSGESLAHWLEEYRLGEMFRSGTLEGLP